MKADPCSVCRGTDYNLLDGFYYCVECGTQDVNIQETIVEDMVLADGTFAFARTQKVTNVDKQDVQMSGEWYKWHTLNFILSGLADEVVACGASQGFKAKVLWIWSRYMKKYCMKDKMGTADASDEKDKSKLFEAEDSDADEDNNEKSKLDDKENDTTEEEEAKDLKIVTKFILVAIIYIALNFDKSDIQLSHLCRFVAEGRISVYNFKKFIPKEMNTKAIPNWKNFIMSNIEVHPFWIRRISMTLIKQLDLGNPVVPDIRKLVGIYSKELCLPNEFKNLVFFLMYEFPYIWDKMRIYAKKHEVVRIPDYEGVTMTYFLVALKICFGLDDDYEISLSNAVGKINADENRTKSYRLGKYANFTERLFSFSEWCNFLQFRKTILCKYCLMMAQDYNFDVDDQVFMGQVEKRQVKSTNLADEVTMDILNKLHVSDEIGVIPRSEFRPSLTPISSYTETIVSFVQDPELKLLLSEDFTQYSLKYACEDFKLLIGGKNIIKGISEESKTVVEVIHSRIDCKTSDLSVVFVRNCENKHWMKTKPPTLDHLTKIDQDGESSRETDHGYDTNEENASNEKEIINSPINSQDENVIVELKKIDEEEPDVNIYDDDFNDIIENVEHLDETKNESFYLNADNDMPVTDNDDLEDHSLTQYKFDPENFDRESTIKELVLFACKTHKIPIPNEYKEPRKRKHEFVSDQAGGGAAKRKRRDNTIKLGESKEEMQKILSVYYANLHKDLISKTAREILSFHDDFKLPDGGADEVQAVDSKSTTAVDDVEAINNNLTENTSAENDSDTESSRIDLIPKTNPEFDDKVYDIKQLYVKCKDDFVAEDFLEDIDDPEINKIIDRKIEESENFKSGAVITDQHNIDLNDDADNDLFLNENDTEILVMDANKSIVTETSDDRNFENLIQNHEHLENIKYWFRHYKNNTLCKSINMKEKFEKELRANFSVSFNFIITECASILRVTPYSLYKNMQYLEQQFSNYENELNDKKIQVRKKRK